VYIWYLSQGNSTYLVIIVGNGLHQTFQEKSGCIHGRG